jgi:hypothetical protein
MAGSPKKRAKTGGRKPGITNRRMNAGELLEYIKRELRSRHLLTWPEDWDPVARMAVLAEKHFDKDPYLALAALKEITKYIRPALQSIQIEATVEEKKAVDLSDSARRFDELIRRPAYGLDAAGRRLCLTPSGQLVPETMIDEAGRKFHRDVSGKWVSEDQFSERRAIEYRPIESEVEDLEFSRVLPD